MDSTNDNKCNKLHSIDKGSEESTKQEAAALEPKQEFNSTQCPNSNEGIDNSGSSYNDEDEGSTSGVRSKPAREIYRPPNLRPGRRTYHGKLHKYDGGDQQHNQNRSNNFSHQQSQHPSQFFARQTRPRPFNIYAKEFHFNPGNSQFFMQQTPQQQQNQSHPRPFYTALIQQQQQQQHQAQGQNYFPLSHSKSSGTMMSQFQEYIQAQQQQQQQQQKGFNPQMKSGGQGQGILSSGSIKQETVLQRNKSSGSIPTKPRVWFQEDQMDTQNFETMDRPFSMLRITAENKNLRQNAGAASVPGQLQRSRSLFYNEQSQQVFSRQNPDVNQLYNNQMPITRTIENNNNQAQGIQRSKSFGWTSGRCSLKDSLVPISSQLSPQNFADFQLEKWPKNVQEAVTATISESDRAVARTRIEMVTLIFKSLFGQHNLPCSGSSEQNKKFPQNTDSRTLVLPAARILVFFIQKEKDSTVQESLLNTSYATFKDLFCFSGGVSPTNWSFDQYTLYPPKWIAFLSFVSTVYSMLKNGRVVVTKSLDELNLALLSLLCDCCLAILRASPDFYTTDLMEMLFTVLTSLGRDIELKIPLKMKQILAAIRDLLLGISPYFNQTSSLQPAAQKTLMQLIELHAANWNLPASAVRYYYAHPSNPNNSASRGELKISADSENAV